MKPRFVRLLLSGNRVLGDAVRPDFLTTYAEQTQAPSLSVLPVPRQYGRQGYKDGVSPFLHYSAHLSSKHRFHLELPKLAKMPTAWAGRIHSHCSPGCAVFHERSPAVVCPVTEIPSSPRPTGIEAWSSLWAH